MLKPVESTGVRWSANQLEELREVHASFRGDLTETAAAIGRSKSDCDLALFTLMGRTALAAALIMNDRLQLRGAA